MKVLKQAGIPLGAIVTIKCYRRSSSQTTWCAKTNKHHVEIELRGVVVYSPETDGKHVAYEFEPWWAARQPIGREVFIQQILPHHPGLVDIVSVESLTGGERLRCGDEYSIANVDGTYTDVPEGEVRDQK